MTDDPTDLTSDGQVKLWAGSSAEAMLKAVSKKLETADIVEIKLLIGRVFVAEDTRSAWLRYADTIEVQWWAAAPGGYVDLSFRSPVVRSTFISYLSEELAKFRNQTDKLSAIAIFLGGYRMEASQSIASKEVKEF